jgi:hypothetical protein
VTWKVWEKEKEMVVRVGVEILGLLVVRKLEYFVTRDMRRRRKRENLRGWWRMNWRRRRRWW